MSFGERLRQARKHARLTQKALSMASGVSQSVISEAENGDYDGSRYMVQLASACGVRSEWLSTGRGHMLPDEAIGETEGAYRHTRFIPVVSEVTAGNPAAAIDAYARGGGKTEISLDPILAAECGPATFGLAVRGDSMMPDFAEGDVVVVDPDLAYRPGDIVVAYLGSDESDSGETTIKRYRDRGIDPATGMHTFELIPRNPDYATIVVNSARPGRIIGPVVEHRRRLRRG